MIERSLITKLRFDNRRIRLNQIPQNFYRNYRKRSHE